MAALFILLILLVLTSVQSFLAPSSLSPSCAGCPPAYLRDHDTLIIRVLQAHDMQHRAAASSVEHSSTYPGDDAPLVVGINESLRGDAILNQRKKDRLGIDSVVEQSTYPGCGAINESRRIDATALAESKKPAGAYQITRPRWYNKSEVAIIVLLCQRLRMIDLKGVEHMLDAQKTFSKQDPRDIWERALFIKAAAPGANFRTVIQRHPRTLLVPVHKMQRVLNIIREAYPHANIARVIERIPSVLSRNATRLEGNVEGLKMYAPEVDSAIFQAAPSMIYLPPHTVEEKVAALRACLPGVNLYNFLKGMPTALARSKETVPRAMSQLKERFPTASYKELVRIVESAPSLVRMSGANGTLSIKVDHLMSLLPGVNVTNVISNAPGVLIRGVASLPAKVTKLQDVFPSANITKMVSRTPGIIYLDIDRTLRPKAGWIQQAVGLDQEGLDRLIEEGPWLLKAGWGPLARLEFAIEDGVARIDRPSSIFSLVRRSRVAFAKAHHPAYANFLKRKLEEEAIKGGGRGEEGVQKGGSGALHPLAWSSAAEQGAGQGASRSGPVVRSESNPARATLVGKRTARLENAGATTGVVSESGDEGDEDEVDLMERTALEVAELESALGRGRKSRLAGVKDRPPISRQTPLARLRGSPLEGDALLDLGQEDIVAYDSPAPRQLGE